MNFVKSIVLESYGNYDSIKIKETLLGKPQTDEVLVDVHYCGLNFCDILTRIGIVGGKKPPFILGIECAGVISAVGSKSSECILPELNIGNRVVCFNYMGGLFAEKIVCARKSCFLIPDKISLKDAVSLFVNYLTAYICLFELGNLKEGEKVFIKSSAGGVGWAATQLAHIIPNVTVFGTSAELKHDKIMLNGVNFPLSKGDVVSQLMKLSPDGIDLILENEAIGDFSPLRNLLKPLGRVVVIGANNIVQNENSLSFFGYLKMWWTQRNISLEELMVNNRSISGFHLGILADQNPIKLRQIFHNICDWFLEGKIKPRIDSEWYIDKIIEATKIMAERKNVGKIVLSVKN